MDSWSGEFDITFRLYYIPIIGGESTSWVELPHLLEWAKLSFNEQLDAYCQAMAKKGVMPEIVQLNQYFAVQRRYFLISIHEVAI